MTCEIQRLIHASTKIGVSQSNESKGRGQDKVLNEFFDTDSLFGNAKDVVNTAKDLGNTANDMAGDLRGTATDAYNNAMGNNSAMGKGMSNELRKTMDKFGLALSNYDSVRNMSDAEIYKLKDEFSKLGNEIDVAVKMELKDIIRTIGQFPIHSVVGLMLGKQGGFWSWTYMTDFGTGNTVDTVAVAVAGASMFGLTTFFTSVMTGSRPFNKLVKNNAPRIHADIKTIEAIVKKHGRDMDIKLIVRYLNNIKSDILKLRAATEMLDSERDRELVSKHINQLELLVLRVQQRAAKAVTSQARLRAKVK